MKVTLLQENLHQALQKVQRIVPGKPSLPILSAIQVTTSTNSVVLAGTDLYLGMKTVVPAKIDQEGVVAVPGKTLSEVIAQLSPGSITLTLQENTLIIEAADGTTKIQCQAASDFPTFPTVEEGKLSLPTTMLETILEQVLFAVSTDVSRPVLTSLLWVFSAQAIDVVATDGFRLAFTRFAGLGTGELGTSPTQWLVPARALQEVAKIAAQQSVEEVQCDYSINLKQLVFTVDQTSIYIRLLDGSFPPYQKIIPSVFNLEFYVDPATLLQHIKRAQIFAREASHIIHFEVAGDKLTVSATSPTAGTHQSHLPIEVIKEGAGKIAFNLKYVTDVLHAATDKRVWFGMSESLKPALFRIEGQTDYGYVVMPFRVNE